MTTNLTTNFSLPIPPLGAGGTADDYSGLMTTADSNIFSKTGGGAWTDYSSLSTITGWSVVGLSKVIKYKKVGNLVFVTYYIAGTSDDIVATFTLATANSVLYTAFGTARIIDNGGSAIMSYSWMGLSTQVVIYPTPDGGVWTGSGTKAAMGQFFYEVA